MLNRTEKKHLINLIIVAAKKDGTISVFEKRNDTTMNFTTLDAAREYLEKITKEKLCTKE